VLVEPDNICDQRRISDRRSAWARLAPGIGQVGLIAAIGQPHVVSDIAIGPSESTLSGPVSNCDLLGVPLNYQSRVLGVLQVVRPRETPDTADTALEALSTLAPQAAIAIAKAQLHETISRERRQLQAILDHTPAAVVMCDTEGVIQIGNPEAERMLNILHLNFEAVKGRQAHELIRELAPDAELEGLGVPCAVEVILGRLGEYLVHVAPITDPAGEVHGYVAVAQDVTQMRRMDRMKSNLNRVLTHDLGNLLMLARNPLELIDDPELKPDQRDQLKQMLSGSMARMEALLKDVMDLDLLPSIDEHTVSPYHLDALAQQSVEHNRDAATRKQITLSYRMDTPLPHPLSGHEVLIMQAIDNLVSNAVKYTPAGGEVTVTTGVENDFAFVQVADNGYGIPVDKLDKIFEPFVRVRDSRTAHIQGTGLGLNLVKTFVEAHSGHVTVESQVDSGSVFTIYLPLKLIEVIQAPTSALTRVDLSPLINGGNRK
jgi:two-component system phosphate regulon sensor histidine kinase PhoR